MDMKKALEANKGLKGVKSSVVEVRVDELPTKAKPKNINITDIHSYQFEKEGVRLWRFHKIGAGFFVPFIELPTFGKSELIVIDDYNSDKLVGRKMITKQADVNNEGIYFYCAQPHCFRRFSDQQKDWKIINYMINIPVNKQLRPRAI